MDDRVLLLEAIALAQHTLPSAYAFSVGALIVDAHGGRLAAGYTHQHDPRDHAEEVALAALGAGLAGPGGRHALQLPRTVQRPRVPAPQLHRADPGGRDHPRGVRLARAGAVRARRGRRAAARGGVEVVELSELADAARDVNLHLPV